jgi:hypothetical protein
LLYGLGRRRYLKLIPTLRKDQQPADYAPVRIFERPERVTWLRGLCLVLLVGVFAGCSERRVAAPVKINAEQVAQEALKQLDANGDGLLDEAELAKAPGLLSCLQAWDTDKDGKLSKAELAEGLVPLTSNEVGLRAVSCRVYMDERPLQGATVSLTPEKFLGAEMKGASGKSDSDGRVRLQVAGQELPGVPPGIYRIEVSLKDAGGQETIPSRYNTETVLGKQIGVAKVVNPNANSIILRLTSSR